MKTDIFHRAVPWSQLILESGFLPMDLNLQISHRTSAVLVGLLILMLLLVFLDVLNFFDTAVNVIFVVISLVSIVTLLTLNRTLYTFL